MFVVNLAFSDLCMMITQGPNVIINCFTNRVWMWGHLGCKLYAFTGALFGVISIITMVIIGYDRYNVIVKVLKWLMYSNLFLHITPRLKGKYVGFKHLSMNFGL